MGLHDFASPLDVQCAAFVFMKLFSVRWLGSGKADALASSDKEANTSAQGKEG